MNAIIIKGNSIKISVSVFLFKDGDTCIAYCPSLDLSGYDTTEEKAKADFQYMLKDWLKTQTENNTLDQDLLIHGWKVEEGEAKEPKVVDLIKRSSARKVFELPDFRKTNVNAEIFY